MLYPHMLPHILIIALVANLAACDPEHPAPGTRDTSAVADTGLAVSSGLAGTWRLDTETQGWVARACVVLDFPAPERASFQISHEAEELYVRFDSPARTVWRSPFRKSRFDAQQILPTTKAGNSCGRETTVRLRLREVQPGVIRGVWQTPHCSVCPDRHFGATRLEN